MVFLICRQIAGLVNLTRKRNAKKSLLKEASGAVFRFFSYAQSPLMSGAKVKKETENSSIHAYGYLIFATQQIRSY